MALPKFPSLGDELKKELNNEMREKKLREAEKAEKLPQLIMPALEEIDIKKEELDYKDLPEEIGKTLNPPVLNKYDNVEEEKELDYKYINNSNVEDIEVSESDNLENDDFTITDEDNLSDLVKEESLENKLTNVLNEVENESEVKNEENWVDEELENEEFPLLSGITSDNEEVPLLAGLNYGDEDSKVENGKTTGPKEFDDEKVKLFFDNIKAKLFNKSKSKNKGKPLKKPKEKEEKTKGKIKKPAKPRNNKKIVVYVVILITVLISGYFALNKYSNIYSSLINIEKSVVKEDLNYELSNFSSNGEIVEFTIENKGDISSDYFLYITLKPKGLFGTEKVVCTTNFIALEPGNKSNETATCNNILNNSLEYKISVDTQELP